MENFEKFSAEKAMIRQATPAALSKLYELVCEEYAVRLCAQFGFSRDNSFWFAEQIGGSFVLNEFYSIPLDEMVYIVNNAVPWETFTEWQNYCEKQRHIFEMGGRAEFINLQTWMSGYHGKED